jgi:hypothetical protein
MYPQKEVGNEIVQEHGRPRNSKLLSAVCDFDLLEDGPGMIHDHRFSFFSRHLWKALLLFPKRM